VAIDREKALAAAQKYVEKKKYDRAVIEYQRIIQEDPNDARTLLKMGDLQSKMEAYAEAIATYERVGKFYASQGFSLKAIAVYKQIRELVARHVPQLEDKYSHITPKLAELYQQLGLTSDALATLDEVATRLQRQNRDQEAIGVFRKIVELDPTNPLPHLRLAEALSHTKDTDGAVAEFGTASSQLLKLGRRDDALKVIERLLHHKADAAYARTAAEVYLARSMPNDGMQALAKLQICFQANPRDLETLGLLARAFTQIGQAAKAIEVQKEMARIARDTGKTQLYRDLVAKLVKIAPNDEGVRQLATASQAPAAASSAPPKSAPRAETEPDAEIEQSDASYEDVGDGDFEPEEQPIALARRIAATEPDSEVIVETGIDVVEEVGDPPTAAGAHEHVARVLGDAATFRRARLYNKAVEILRIGLGMAPKALEVHEMLRDVLLEAGHTREASTAMVQIASLLVETLDGEAAARALQEALALDPNNLTASAMLHELGYELVEEPPPQSADDPGGEAPPMRGARGSYDPEAPLPAYALDEVDPEDSSLRTEVGQDYRRSLDPRRDPSEPSMTAVAVGGPPRGEIGDIDDPFADAPLPSYPLEPAPESASAFELVGDRDVAGQPAPQQAPPAALGGTLELESALEEAEFFLSRGLFEDARTILQEQLARLPNNRLLLERITELDAQERSMVGGSGTRPSPAAAAAENDRAFDIAESLGAIEAERVSGVGPGGGSDVLTEQVDVEEVFAKFKAGVAQQISVDDTQSHYDLGVAYKEMGLLDDAIREFDLASRDPKRECVCHSMIGMIQLERGNINEAIDAFTRGLRTSDRTKEQEAALCYEIGAAYEAKKMIKQALEHFQRTARLMSSYRDVQERVRRLQKVEQKQPARAVAVGADDEFERAFDDILAGRKLP
jgi:tetratricopeptide (TPR) repeat protein